LFLDTPECNAHTTAADILWSGTPIITYPRHAHKLCSRVVASIASATGLGEQMVVGSPQEYEDRAVAFATTAQFVYTTHPMAVVRGGEDAAGMMRTTLAEAAAAAAVHGRVGPGLAGATAAVAQPVLAFSAHRSYWIALSNTSAVANHTDNSGVMLA